MKSMLKGFLSISLLLVAGTMTWQASADNCGSSCNTSTSCNDRCESDCNDIECCDPEGPVLGTKTHFSMRGANFNTARQMVGVMDKIHKYGAEEFNGVFSVGLQYQQTYKSDKLAKYLFGKKTLTYSDDCTAGADIYGPNLGTTGTGTISFAPKIQNFIADFDLWLGLDEFVCGLWARIDVPVNWTKWSLNPCQRVETEATSFAAGQVAFLDAGTQTSFAGIQAGLAGAAFGAAPALACGKICAKGTSTTAVAALNLDLGYDFIRRECGWLGASLHVVAPTGTKPSDEFLFNAVSGSQHAWGVGTDITAGYHLWEGCEGDQALSLYFDAVIVGMFGSKQRRVFDLKNVETGLTSPLSYLQLLKKFDPATGDVVGLERAANILCCNAKIAPKVITDLSLMLQYDCGCFSSGLGWNFYLATKERLSNCNENTSCDRDNACGTNRNCTIAANTYGIKGDATINDATDTTTHSNATIATCGTADATPVYLTTESIDFCSGLAPRYQSNKVFGWVGWNWKDCEWQPDRKSVV